MEYWSDGLKNPLLQYSIVPFEKLRDKFSDLS
jgi:hypothetical protein